MLGFDIDAAKLDMIAREFAASEKQIDLAYRRALRRTSGTLRRMATSGLKTELGLRNTKALRRRVREFGVRGSRGKGTKIWVGANDLPISAFKGRPRKVASGVQFGSTTIRGAFLARRNGRRSVFQRTTDKRYPIAEVLMPIGDRVMRFVEDDLFVDLDAIFFKNFAAEIRARTIYGVGS